MPNIFGEDAVLRILDRNNLGGSPPDQAGQPRLRAGRAGLHRRLSTLPHGLLLATGPTGSGKTTTLYAG